MYVQTAALTDHHPYDLPRLSVQGRELEDVPQYCGVNDLDADITISVD
jgi:hypothetical protein